jgi:hypothetical protein
VLVRCGGPYYLYQDIATGEWLFRGRWYEEYPREEIEKYEQECIEEGDWRHHQRRDERKEMKLNENWENIG